MNPIHPDEEELFHRALALPTNERAAFLARECAGNAPLRAAVESLLQLHSDTNSFLESPAPEIAATAEVRPPVAAEAPGTRIGRYKLLQKIGEGGCGTVYMAEQEEPVRRRVALKVIKLGMDTKEVIARFEAERQALALMDHPNIARVLDAGATQAGRPYFVMELVRGVKLTDYCDQNNLSTTARLELFTQVCNAVQHAHQKGIIHRDLKPSNILVTLNDGKPVPKVIDFGIAKATQGRLTDATLFTAFEQFIGTPAYMSPEQAEMSSLDVDTRSDIYSLGVLLYELLAGRPPFDPKTLVNAGIDEIRRIIREVEPARPSMRLNTLADGDRATIARQRGTLPGELSSLLRGDLDWIVMRCLEKDRTRRYETANGVALDVLRHLRDEPVTARPPSGFYRLQKLARRNKAAVTASAAVLAALVVGLAVSTWQYVEKSKAHRRAVAAEQNQSALRQHAEQANQRESQQRQTAEKNASLAQEQETNARRLLYAADMNLAQQALQASNLGRARRLLERHQPKPGETDLRGWEWRYLWQQCRSGALVSLTQHTSKVGSVSFSRDGRRLAVGYWDGRTEVWDVVARKLETVLRTSGEYSVVRFSPSADVLAHSGARGEVVLYDLNASKVIATHAPAIGAAFRMAFSRDGKLLGCVGGDGIQVIDVARNQIVLTKFNDGFGGSPLFGGIRFSADGTQVLANRSGDSVRNGGLTVAVFRLPDAEQHRELHLQKDWGLTAMDASPDGRLLVTATGLDFDTVCVWNADTLAAVTELRPHVGWVGELAFSPDGATLASASADQTIRLWDAATWTERAILRGHGNEVHAVAFSPDGQLLASGDKSGEVLLWSAAQSPSTEGRFDFPADIANAAFLPGESAVLTRSTKGKISRWEMPGLRETPLPAPAEKIKYFWPPNFLGTQTPESIVRVYAVRGSSVEVLGEVQVGEKATEIDFDSQRHELRWQDVSGNHQRARVGAAGPDPAQAKIDAPATVRVESGEVVFRRATGSNAVLARHSLLGGWTAMAYSPDSKLVAVATNHALTNLYDRTTQQHVHTLRGHLMSANGVAFTPDSRRLATVCGGREAAKIWDANTGQELLNLTGHRGDLDYVSFSQPGDALLVGSRNGHWQLWHVPAGEGIEPLEKPVVVARAPAPPRAVSPAPPARKTRGIYVVEIEPGTGRARGPATLIPGPSASSNCAPAWSPDGKAIAFKRPRPVSSDPKVQYYDWIVRNVTTGEEKTFSVDIPDAGGWSGPLWYPDGRQLLGKSFMEQSSIRNFRLNVETADTTEVPMPAYKPAVAVSLDGKTIYAVAPDPIAKAISIVALDSSGRQTALWKSPFPFHYVFVPLRLVLSPDGRTLATILANGTKESHLIRVNVDGSDYRSLYSNRGDAASGSALSRSALAWGDRGRALFFMDGNDSDQRLLRISAEGGKPEVTGLMMGGNDIVLDVSPDGTRLALSPGEPIISSAANKTSARSTLPESELGFHLYAISIDADTGKTAGELRRVTRQSLELPAAAAISPDGAQMAHWYHADSESGLAITATRDGETKLHRQINGRGQIAWRNQTELLFQETRQSGGPNVISVFDLATGNSRRVMEADLDDAGFDWQWVPMRNEIVFISKSAGESGAREFKAFSLASGKTRSIASIGNPLTFRSTFRVSPDGQHIAYGRYASRNGKRMAEMRLMTIDGVDEKSLLPDTDKTHEGWRPSGYPYAWSPNGKFLLYDRYPGVVSVLSLQTGESWPIPGAADKRAAYEWAGATWSPDGKLVAITRYPNN